MNKLFLASKSPRRREILETMGIDFELVSGECDEIVNDWERPDQVVMSIALQKRTLSREEI